ncbi:hypothetical protein BGZ94_004347 [Podila epigama]|nr:hypothetical protein BGZ94_004347 [Podila epigama]
MKEMLAGNSPCFGKKCDLLFLSKKLELANFEFKAAGKSTAVLESQRKKNLRLNRSILESLKEAGFEAPAMLYADFDGFSGTIYALTLMAFVPTFGESAVAATESSELDLSQKKRLKESTDENGEVVHMLPTENAVCHSPSHN